MTELKAMGRAGNWVSTHPLTPGIRVGDVLWLSGTAPVNLDTGAPVEGDIVAQAEAIFDNMAAVLALEGIGLERVVRLTNYLTSQADLPGLNSVYRRRFAEPFPARATVIVAGLVNPAYRIVVDGVAIGGIGPRQA